MPDEPHIVSQPLFAEPSFDEDQPTPDANYFNATHDDDHKIRKDIDRHNQDNLRSFEKSRLADDQLFTLKQALGSQGDTKIREIEQAGQIVFHAVGDTGSVTSSGGQNLVADVLVADCHAPRSVDRPAFFFHLGDVVYSFGEAQHYYDQFYEPYQNYPGPIFAIAGNHEGMVSPRDVDQVKPLETYYRNFCQTEPQFSPDALTIHRTTMTQPGVYFTLDAPFVRIIGLFSNALGDPGVISSQKGHYKKVPDYQLDFLEAQLKRIRDEHYQGCVLLALHHPPFAWKGDKSEKQGGHGGSPKMLAQIDKICEDVGIYPHAVLSGHVHNYQRFTRKFKFGKKKVEVPFIIAGCGGHEVSSLVRKDQKHPDFHSEVKHIEHDLILEKYNDLHFGYLRITVDSTTLRIAFFNAESPSFHQSEFDGVTVDLKSHTLISNRLPLR